jgi:hypothetical protein
LDEASEAMVKFLLISEPGDLAAVTGKKFVRTKFSNVNAEGNPEKPESSMPATS